MLKKILAWGGLAFLVFFIAFRPEDAADVASNVGGFLLKAANGVARFLIELAT